MRQPKFTIDQTVIVPDVICLGKVIGAYYSDEQQWVYNVSVNQKSEDSPADFERMYRFTEDELIKINQN